MKNTIGLLAATTLGYGIAQLFSAPVPVRFAISVTVALIVYGLAISFKAEKPDPSKPETDSIRKVTL